MELVAVARVQPGEHHRLLLAVAGQRFGCPGAGVRDGVANAAVAHALQPCREITHLARCESGRLGHRRSERPDLQQVRLRARRHHPNAVRALHRAVHDPHVRHHALVRVVLRVEHQRAQRPLLVRLGRRNALHDRLQQRAHARAVLRGDLQHLVRLEAERRDQLFDDPVGLGGRQVDLVHDRDDGEVVLQREVDVGERLRLDALRCVDDQQRSLARRERARDFVREVDVPRRVDEVQLVVAALIGEPHADGLRLDGDAALALEVHRIEQLVVHLARGDSARDLQDAVGERRLAVVDVGDDAEVADERGVHAPHSSREALGAISVAGRLAALRHHAALRQGADEPEDVAQNVFAIGVVRALG